MHHPMARMVSAFFRWVKVHVFRMHVSEDSHLFRRH